MSRISRRTLMLSLPAAVLAAPLAQAAGERLRMATLMPRGSLYHRGLLELGEKWRQAEGRDASFTVFTDGVQGDEPDIVRRMRIGQLNGALISVIGLCAIEPGVAALQYMPLMFRSWEELDAASRRLRPLLEQRIAARGFVVLYWGEAGWVRFFSKTAGLRPIDFAPMKIFSWSGTPEQVELMRALGYKPVALETADILPGLQTGLIDMVPVTATWALASQIDAIAPHMLDIRWVPIVGAAVITRAAWESTSPAGRAALREAAVTAAAALRAERDHADQAAIDAMRRRGLTVHSLSPTAQGEWEQLVATTYPRIRGTMVPTDTFDLVQQAVSEFRGERPAT